MSDPALPKCPDCGEPVECGAALGREECWCTDYPPEFTVPLSGAASCYCEACLKKRMKSSGPLPIVG